MRTEYQRAYSTWGNMKRRCYNPQHKDYPSYGSVGVRICEEWLEFKNFYNWYKDNYYEIDGQYMAVDKDILGDGMLYSPETCLIVPFKINGMFVHKVDGDMRGIQKRGKRFEVKLRNVLNDSKNEYKGTFDTLEIASQVYRECKEAIIRGVAEEYKDKVPFKVYNALVTFKFKD